MQMRGIITEVSRRALGEHGRVDLGHQDIVFALSRGILHTHVCSIPTPASLQQEQWGVSAQTTSEPQFCW